MRFVQLILALSSTSIVTSNSESLRLNPVADLGARCDQVERTSFASSPPASALYVGLSHSGTLICSSTASKESNRTLSQNANSFTIAAALLIYTTTSHESWYVPISSLSDTPSGTTGENAGGAGAGKEVEGTEKRKVERGSRIVVAVPSTMAGCHSCRRRHNT
jgi:hypothetical protein